MLKSTRAELLAELAQVNEKIDRAYWAFTRQARAKPPILVCPEAYERRAQIEASLRALRDENKDEPTVQGEG